MKIIGSIIARGGSKRLPYKNLLPFNGVPMLGLGIQKLQKCKKIDTIVVSTENELIARVAHEFGAIVLQRPIELAQDNIPSIPVFKHILENFPADLHVNLNINFPLCDISVIDRAIEIAKESGESLSVPYAVWAQTSDRLKNYGDYWKLPESQFKDEKAGQIDVHTEQDLIEVYRLNSRSNLPNWKN